jgi:hypothetical protein
MKRTNKDTKENTKVYDEEKEDQVLNMVSTSGGKYEPPSLYFKDMVKKIEKKPDQIQLPKFKKEKKTNPHKNNIVLVL